MSTSPSDTDLLYRALDGLLDERQQVSLADRLRDEPALAEEFIARARDEAMLHELVAEARTVGSLNAHTPAISAGHRRSLWRMTAMTASLLLPAVVLWVVIAEPSLPLKSPSPGAQDSPAIDETAIAALCEDLGSETIETREAASRQLINLGVPVVNEVVKLLWHQDPDVRERAETILVKIGIPSIPPCQEAAKQADSGVRLRAERALASIRWNLFSESVEFKLVHPKKVYRTKEMVPFSVQVRLKTQLPEDVMRFLRAGNWMGDMDVTVRNIEGSGLLQGTFKLTPDDHFLGAGERMATGMTSTPGLSTVHAQWRLTPPEADRFAKMVIADDDQFEVAEPKQHCSLWIEKLTQAIQQYKESTGAFPASDNEVFIKVLRTGGPQGTPLLKIDRGMVDDKNSLLDPWDRPYRYALTADGYELYSVGPDGVDDHGANDDIR